MTLPGFTPEPFRVVCDGCGAEGFTFDYQRPGAAVGCGCCPVAHDHDAAADCCPRVHEGDCGKGVPRCTVCRPVTVYGTACLRFFQVSELMEAAGTEAGDRLPEPSPSRPCA